MKRCLEVFWKATELEIGVQNDDFMTTFAKLYENPILHEDDAIGELLRSIYNHLRTISASFEGEYLDLRRKIIDAKDRLKSERKLLAITDPAK